MIISSQNFRKYFSFANYFFAKQKKILRTSIKYCDTIKGTGHESVLTTLWYSSSWLEIVSPSMYSISSLTVLTGPTDVILKLILEAGQSTTSSPTWFDVISSLLVTLGSFILLFRCRSSNQKFDLYIHTLKKNHKIV